MGTFRVVESIAIADAALDLEGQTLDDLFATAAAALADLQIDPATLDRTATTRITLRAPSIDLLLFDWLGELIFRKDRDRLVFPEAAVTITREAGWTLTATLRGGSIASPHVALRADVKAVTLHDFEVTRAGDGWRARVIFDI
jgi:SHS2 domain-containing protein